MNRPEIFDRVREAFDRGRWVMLTASDGAPQEITIDLKERPDDLLGIEFKTGFADPAKLLRAHAEQRAIYEAGLGILSDDHGPAVPAQGRPQWANGEAPPEVLFQTSDETYPKPGVAEVSLQVINSQRAYFGLSPASLDGVTLNELSEEYTAADWVHVYDSVTRERRTLKRPPSDAVLTGLADVAADLRGQSPAQPAPGPLTSTDGLLPGDVLRVVRPYSELASGLCRYNGAKDGSGGRYECIGVGAGRGAQHMVHRFAFVGRPDADGWMDWPGGENPVGDSVVDLKWRDRRIERGERAANNRWSHKPEENSFHFADIVRFRLVDMPPLTGDA